MLIIRLKGIKFTRFGTLPSLIILLYSTQLEVNEKSAKIYKEKEGEKKLVNLF